MFLNETGASVENESVNADVDTPFRHAFLTAEGDHTVSIIFTV